MPPLFVLFAATVIVVHLVSPVGPDGRVSFLAATCGAAVVACAAVLIRGRDQVRVWLAAAIAASALGDVAWEAYVVLRGEGPDVSFADAGWLASYVCVGVALGLLIRRSRVRWRDSPDIMFDAATAAVISATAAWVFWVSPTMFNGADAFGVRLVWSAYPVLDAVLLGALARVVLTRPHPSRALRLVASGVAMWLLADIGFLVWSEDSAAGPWLDVGWMLGSLLLAAGTWALSTSSLQQVDAAESRGAATASIARTSLTVAPIFVVWLLELWALANGWTIDRLPLLASNLALFALVYGRIVHLIGQRQRAESQLRANEHLYRALATHSSDAALLVDRSGRLLRDSPSLAALARTDLVGSAGSHLLALSDLSVGELNRLRAAFRSAVSHPREVVQVEFAVVNASEEQLWLCARVVSLLDDPAVGGVVINLHDITERKLAEETVARAAWVDDLTGLPNRQSLSRQLHRELTSPDETVDSVVGVVLVDLCRFRIVNDSLGHDAGDELLRTIADRLGDAVEERDVVARFGGDVFAVLARRTDRAAFADLGARLAEAVHRPLSVEGRSLEPTITIGVALAAPRSEVDSVLAVADDALHRAKDRGVERLAIIDVDDVEGCNTTLDDELELRAAISGGQLELDYQAVVDVSQRKIDGFEALVRWNHPTRGRLGPGEFIPLAEESGLIVPLDAWVLDTALDAASGWDAELSVAVNLSPLHVTQRGLAERVHELLDRHDVDPSRLILEVTESSLVDDDQRITEPLETLRALGVRISVDDFGTGYSSFAYLRRLPVDILKIDKSFIDDIPGDGEPIVEAIIGLANSLGLDVIAEGIERDEQLETLDRLGCHHIQGFLTHRPAPATELCGDLATPACNNKCRSIGTPRCTEQELHLRRRDRTPPPDSGNDRRRVQHHDGGIHMHHDGPGRTSVTAEVSTKRTLATLSHAIEEIAAAAGPDATVISLFQRGQYFAPMVPRYEQLAERRSTVIVAYAGDGPTAEGVHHVTLTDDDPLAAEWAIILITSSVAAHVRAEDLVDFDPTAADLESGRRFAATWGFDRHNATEHARELVRRLEASLPPATVDRVRDAISAARSAPRSIPERSLSAAASVLAARLDRTQRELSATTARLVAETELATRDPLTGLLNREGLERWLGGHDTDGLAMPPMGVVLIDLDRFKQINDTLGHLAGDNLLQGIAAALLANTRPGDVAARWGGDEFIVLCPHAADDELRIVANRLLDAIAAVDIDGAQVTASAGIQTCTQRPLPLDHADTALYAAKQAGGGHPVLATG